MRFYALLAWLSLTGIALGQAPSSSNKTLTANSLGQIQPEQINGHDLTYKGTAVGGTGTVTSVGIAAPSILSVAGSPITTSGTITLSLAPQSANAVFAGPISGGSATPTFRALVSDDIPDLSSTYQTPLTFADSITKTGATVTLTNDSSSPGNSKYYGTNGTGTLGYFSLPSSAVWGSITGTLSSQTDLQSALNAKQNTLTLGNLTDVGTDGITVTGGTGAIVGSGTSLSQHVADTTHNGYLSSTDWNTFNGKQSSLTIGNLTDAGTDGIIITGGTGAVIGSGASLSQHVSDSTHNGYLSSTDWIRFDGAVSAAGVSSFNSRTGAVTPQSGDYTASLVGLGNVTNNAQTQASIVPNTAPSAGEILIGNAGNTAYAKQTVSGSGATVTLSSAGVLTLSSIANASLTNSSITIGGTSTALGGSVLGNVTNDTQTKAAVVPNTLPSSGQLLVGNAGGTAYAPASLSGSGATASLSSSGVLTLSGIANATLTNSSVTIAGNSLSLGGSLAASTLLGSLSATSASAFDFNSQKITSISDPTNPTDGANKNYVDLAIAAINPGTGSQVLTGCGVAWSGTGLGFVVSAGTYSINGTTYSVSQTTVTLSAADGTNPRIDLIIVDTSGVATKITGTPSANPVQPTVDSSTQLNLTFVYVAAGATTPGNVVSTLIYDEAAGSPTEWPPATSGSTWNTSSTNNPFSGTKDTEATSVGSSTYVQYVKGSGTVDPSTQNNLVFNIRSKAAWANNRSVTITLINASTQVGSGVILKDGVFGFSSSNTSSYQQIVIPITSFGAGANAFNTIRFTTTGSGGSIGYYLDLITLQAGVANVTTNAMVWKGTWSSSTAYVKNDTVTYNGVLYVCLIANGNSAPTSTNANWQAAGNPIRIIGFTLDGRGAALTTGKVAGYFECPVPGKITGYAISVDTGTCTVKTWKKATGTAVPTVSDNISTSGVSLSSGTHVRSTTVSDFTSTTVTANDIFAFNVSATSGPTEMTFQLEITPQ